MNFLGPSLKAPLGILTLVNGKRNDERAMLENG